MIVNFELTETIEREESSYLEEIYFDDDVMISNVITTAKHFIDEFDRVTSVRFYFDGSFYFIEKDTEDNR